MAEFVQFVTRTSCNGNHAKRLEIPPPGSIPYSHVSSVGLTWAEDGFAVLYGREHTTLMLQHFVAASP